MKLKLAPLSIKPWTLLAKELEGKPTSSKTNGSYFNKTPLLHKLLHAKLAEAKVLLVLTTRGFVEFNPLQPPSLHTEWLPATLYGCLHT